MRRLLLTLACCATACSSFALSAANWVYDGEFVTTNSAGATRNKPMFLDINSFGELVYADLGSNATGANEVYIVTNIFAAASNSTVPVTQTKLAHQLACENNALRGISGVAFQPGTGNLWLTSDAGAVNRAVQSFTRTGPAAFTPNTTMSLTNQTRVMGICFSPTHSNILVSGELDTATGAQKSKFNVYDVSPGTTLTLLGTVNVPNLGTGRYVRDVAVDASDSVYLNVNGTITRMSGAGLTSSASVSGYGAATVISDARADNDINPMGISWSGVMDQPIVVANRGNAPSADPRLHGVWNSETGAPILQASDAFTSNALRAATSPAGEFGNSCDSKAVTAPDGTPYLFVSETVKARIVRFKAVATVQTSADRGWALYR